MAKSKREPEKRYYLDSNVLVEYVERLETDPLSIVIHSILRDGKPSVGRFDLVTSTISIAEVLYAKREKDGKAIDPEVEKRIARLWHPSSPIRLVDVHELLVKEAVTLFRGGLKDGYTKTGGIDCIHLTTAKREGVHEFFSIGPEQAMVKWQEALGFVVVEPHYESPPAVDATSAATVDHPEQLAMFTELPPPQPPAATSLLAELPRPAELPESSASEPEEVKKVQSEAEVQDAQANEPSVGISELPSPSTKDSDNTKVSAPEGLDKAKPGEEDQKA